jgi:transcriptional antiterminator RfaH
LVCYRLSAKGVEAYCPTHTVQHPDTGSRQVKPFFSRYLFVRADLDVTGISALNWVPGAVGMVMYGDIPANVPHSFIDKLKKRLSELDEAVESVCHQIECGDPVRITSGPLAGYEAIFDSRLSGSERVRVLLSFLDQQVKVNLNASAIEAL